MDFVAIQIIVFLHLKFNQNDLIQDNLIFMMIFIYFYY